MAVVVRRLHRSLLHLIYVRFVLFSRRSDEVGELIYLETFRSEISDPLVAGIWDESGGIVCGT